MMCMPLKHNVHLYCLIKKKNYKDFYNARPHTTSHHHGPERPRFTNHVGKNVSSKIMLETDIIAMGKTAV